MFPAKSLASNVVDSRPVVGPSRRRPSCSVVLLGLLLVFASLSAAAVERPNVLLITLDTTRADHLGLYGYPKDTSPNLDRLAEDAIVYTRAFSTSSWTLPAHASMLTGLYPTSHGAQYDEQGSLVLKDGIRGKKLSRFRASPLAADTPTLGEILKEAGYATGGLVAGPWMKEVFGLGRGFDHYDDSSIDDVHGRLAIDVTEKATTWIDAVPAGAPFFLFLNYYDPHGPYTDPDGHSRRFLPPNTLIFPAPKKPSAEFLRGVYDGEIHYMDHHLGTLFDHLKANGLYDDMLIIVTADHGELLGEHGMQGHGATLHEEELRIPFLVKHPQGGAKPGRSEVAVQLTDVLPLVLKRVGLEAPAGAQGRVPSQEDRRAYAEVYPIIGSQPLDCRVSVEGDYKYVWTSDGAERLFDIRSDPGELVDLSSDQPKRLKQMAERQQRFLADLPKAAPATGETPVQEIDDETRRALEGLGYIE